MNECRCQMPFSTPDKIPNPNLILNPYPITPPDPYPPPDPFHDPPPGPDPDPFLDLPSPIHFLPLTTNVMIVIIDSKLN